VQRLPDRDVLANDAIVADFDVVMEHDAVLVADAKAAANFGGAVQFDAVHAANERAADLVDRQRHQA
jgi:hypothetical protein